MDDKAQVQKFIGLCNSGWQVTVLSLKGEPYPRGQALIDDFIADLSSKHGSFDAILNELLTGAFKYSGVFAELELGKGHRLLDLVTPSPGTLVFRKKSGNWIWGQYQNEGFKELSSLLTVIYNPVFTFELAGQLLAAPFDPDTIRLVRRATEAVLANLFSVALRAQGVLGHAAFEFSERPREFIQIAGGNEATLPPHPLKKRRETVLGMVKAGLYTERDIAKEIGETIDIVKQDKLWLRKRGYLPRPKTS